jgi:glucosamine-phosphate N-acetyltransferase
MFNIRELIKDDYIQYLNIMYEFTNYKYELSKEEFEKHIDEMESNKLKKILIITKDDELIGAGTIFKMVKLHNNPIGQIEDVIITEKFRNYGFGKILIKYLIEIGLKEFKCYKVILNCLEKNIGFYERCGFEEVGFEMKYISIKNY